MSWKGAWRLGRESGSKSTTRRTDNNSKSNSSNSNSNNTNSTIEGDNIKVIINQNIFAVDGSAAQVYNQGAGPSSGPQSDLRPATNIHNNVQNEAQHRLPPTIESKTAAVIQATASDGTVPRVLSVSDSHSTETPGRRLSSVETIGQSLYSVSEYPMPKPINIRKHLPKGTEDYIQAYMSSHQLFGTKAMIPLWKPSPSDKRDPRAWRYHIYVGDVGIFNAEGGFDTLFNIFYSKKRNQESGYDPPNDFVPYPKSLEEMDFDSQQSTLQLAGGINKVGFEDFSKPQTKQSRLREMEYSYRANRSDCSAICLRAGFHKVSIRQWDTVKIQEYIRDHQESWQRHVEETAGVHFRDRALLVIYATWRTKNYALAAGSRPRLEKCQGIITLKDSVSVEGGHTHYEWEVAGGSHIFTQFGPSPQLTENQGSYFSTTDNEEGSKYGHAARKEAEECHCVAIGAFGLRKREWIRGGSVKSGRSSKTTIRPIWARMISLPTQLDSSIQEEVDF